jgi:Mg2+ and Co2+ transporter CorA
MSELVAAQVDTMAAMDSFPITADGGEHEVSSSTVRRLLDASARFWLDLAGLGQRTADGLLQDTFGFHQLAVEDAEHFGQRPKLEDYDGFTLMVVYGAAVEQFGLVSAKAFPQNRSFAGAIAGARAVTPGYRPDPGRPGPLPRPALTSAGRATTRSASRHPCGDRPDQRRLEAVRRTLCRAIR